MNRISWEDFKRQAHSISVVTREEVPDPSELVGKGFDPHPPVTITGEKVAQYAVVTGDNQWIHVSESEAAQGPFGKLVAQGGLVLGCLATCRPHHFIVDGHNAVINVLGEYRLVQPVPVGATILPYTRVIEARWVERGLEVMAKFEIRLAAPLKGIAAAGQIKLLFV